MSDVLTLEDLRITYHTASGGIPAVRGVNLNVKKGEGISFFTRSEWPKVEFADYLEGEDRKNFTGRK